MTAPTSDSIAEVQVLVGCPHDWMVSLSFPSSLLCKRCGIFWDRTKTPPAPAPDCSTLWGALRAAQGLGVFASVTAYGNHEGGIQIEDGELKVVRVTSELDAATVVCELILEARQ